MDKLFAERNGTFACPCGAIRLKLQVPGSSYGLVEQTNAICHCHDCIDFVQSCPNGRILLQNNSTHMVQFYKSDVTVVEGKNKIQAIRLRDGAPLIRCYCQECGTPLGAEFSKGPIMLLYSKFILGENMPLYLPNLVLNYASAPRKTTRAYDSHTTVRKGMLAPVFILRVIGRVFIGFLFRKGKGGILDANGDYDSVPVGLDAIGKLVKSK